MLYLLILDLIDSYSFLNVFKYLTVRTGLAVFTSLLVVFLIGNPFINFFSMRQILDPIREDGPDQHIIKKIGTPTMGGVLILIGLFAGILLWGDLKNIYILFLIYIVGSYGLLGAFDDYKKVKYKNSSGISFKFKLISQILIALIGILFLTYFSENQDIKNLYFPFFKNLIINLGWFFIPFAIFIIVGSSNAVNLTDGLDGLATVPVILVAGCFAFMGDTGSLSLGGSLGAVGIITKHEIVLAITGGLFVLEAVSVIVQVISFKITGKRIFKMAPIHHHYEKKGWPESTVVIRFWIVAIILAMIGLATLKFR